MTRAIAVFIVVFLQLATNVHCAEPIRISRTEEVTRLTVPDAVILGRAVLSPDNRYIAFWDGGDAPPGVLGIYDVQSKRCVFRQSLSDFAKWEDGELVVTGEQRIVWCTAFAFSPDGKRLAVVRQLYDDSPKTRQQILELRNPSDGSIVQTTEWFTGESTVVVYSPDGRTLAVGAHATSSDDAPHAVYLWDAAPLRLRKVISVPHRVETLAFTGNGKLLATLSGFLWAEVDGRRERRRELQQWDVATSQQIGHAQRFSDSWHADAFSFAPGGSLWLSLQIRADVHKLVVWDVDGQRTVAEPVEPKEDHEWDRMLHAIAPSGNAAAISYRSGKTKIIELPGGRLLAELSDHQALIGSICFSHDGTRLITSSWDHTIVIRNVEKILSQANRALPETPATDP